MMTTAGFDAYLENGCGRCEHAGLPTCKVRPWIPALHALRALLQAAGLTEEMKWGSPCYTLAGKNVAMLVSVRDYCALQFFKGAGLEDPAGLLESPGPNSQFGRLLKVRSAAEVEARRPEIERLLTLAVAFEREGRRIESAGPRMDLPEELAARLEADPTLRQAFDALTPGRQRSHVIHISGAKQSETRERRVDRCATDILAGRGFNDR